MCRLVNVWRLYLRGRKGLGALKGAVSQKDLISEVVVAKENGVVEDVYDEILSLAEELGIESFRREDQIESSANKSLSAGWKWMLSTEGGPLVVLHDSLLPRYRGYAPLITALIEGDSELGVTAFLADDSSTWDSGPVLRQKRFDIEYPALISPVLDKVSSIYGEIVSEILSMDFLQISQHLRDQNHSKASISLWRDEHDYWIDWSMPAEKLVRFIHAVGSPYAGARTMVESKTMIIHDAVVEKNLPEVVNLTPGKTIWQDGAFPVVACGQGAIKITSASFLGLVGSAFPLQKTRNRFFHPNISQS